LINNSTQNWKRDSKNSMWHARGTASVRLRSQDLELTNRSPVKTEAANGKREGPQ
jgi:hypothetical protein